MDVQGDYDPIDAGGFIKINALRYVFLLFKTRILESPDDIWILYAYHIETSSEWDPELYT